jgi:HK97 gp10 family phage protein
MVNRVHVDQAALRRVLESSDGPVARELLRVALRLEGTTKRLLSTPGQGRLYPRGRTVVHRASAPGQPPAVDTGRLRASITHTLPERDERGLRVRVGTDVEYARYLEFGTRRMAPRPFLRPAMAAVAGTR